jgi:hypothetical protein
VAQVRDSRNSCERGGRGGWVREGVANSEDGEGEVG